MMRSIFGRAGVALAAVSLAFAAHAQPAGWSPNEQLVSAEPTLIDPEFSQSRAMIAWFDELGGVWLANVDRDTGLFVPADGRGLQIDTDGAALGSAVWAFNGPEWVMGARGDEVTYTRFVSGQPKTGRAARVVVAREQRDGSWRPSLISDQPRYIPFGSENARDRAPRITYLDPEGNHYWKGTKRKDVEHLLTDAVTPYTPIRQVRGAPGVVVFPRRVGDIVQLHQYDLDTETLRQLTFDDGDKTGPWMWPAPEFGNAFVMTAVVNNTLRVYRELPQGDGSLAWQAILERPAPPGLTILSPEPMTYGGRSYVFMGMGRGVETYSAEIWIASVDPASDVFRRITAESPARVRSDPELFITSQGPRIYFNRYQLTDDPEPVPCRIRACSEGMWMADPGLPAR